MRTKFAAFLIISCFFNGFDAKSQIISIPEVHEENETFTYYETIAWYEKLDSASENCVLVELGMADVGLPIHALVLTNEETTSSNIDELRRSRWVLAVNNGIHPGESCGVDASIHWVNQLLSNPSEIGNAMIVVVPMYNIGGALNRGCCTRANQNGPVSQGFRGNARNYDLNRDLIKADTRNTLALYRLFNWFDPEIFVDTHSTNGADYPYEMTLITSPWQKYPESLQPLVKQLEVEMFEEMDDRDVLMSPYVNVFGRTPNEGFEMFVEGAMYTTGYAAITGAVAFVTEAHMLKPYDVRVNATFNFLDGILDRGALYGDSIIKAKEAYRAEEFSEYHIDWRVKSNQADTLDFMAFGSRIRSSKVTTGDRLQYNDKIENIQLPYYNVLEPSLTVVVPDHYYIPIGQWEIIERFQAAGVVMDTIEVSSPEELLARQFKFDSYTFSSYPYEGHMRIDELDVSLDRLFLPVGRYIKISSQQKMGRYLQECLHPLGPTSFTRWNFFATYLQQKEHYSSYVFEDTAEELLENDEELRDLFETKMEEDSEFKGDPRAQLYFIYTHSPYYESAHLHIPYYYSIR